MITAEEFYREKIRVHLDLRGTISALWKYEIDVEKAFIWAKEFADIAKKDAYNEALDRAAEMAQVKLTFKTSFDGIAYTESTIAKESILSLKIKP